MKFDVPSRERSESPEQTRQTRDRDGDGDGDDTEDGHRRHSGREGHRDGDRRRSAPDLYDGTASDDGERRRRRRRRHHDRDADQDRNAESDGQTRSDDRRRRRHRKSRDPQSSASGSQRGRNRRDSSSSEETIDLPPRFDQEGRKMDQRGEDPIADKIQDMLSGKGLAGGIFKRLTQDFLGDDKKRR